VKIAVEVTVAVGIVLVVVVVKVVITYNVFIRQWEWLEDNRRLFDYRRRGCIHTNARTS
jgi:hypothetical protein